MLFTVNNQLWLYKMDSNDDWLYDSIKCYNTLNMYDLQMKPQHLVQVDRERLCLAGKHPDSNKTELLCVRIPEKLFLPKTDQSRCKKSDFEIDSGGFIGVTSLKSLSCLNSEKVIAAVEDETGLTIFNIDNLKTEKILTSQNCQNFDVNPPQTEILSMTDSCFIIFDFESEELSEIMRPEGWNNPVDCCYFDENVFAFIDEIRGSVFTYDRRTGAETIIAKEQIGTEFVFATDSSRNRLICLNNAGDVSAYDDRHPGSPVFREHLVFRDNKADQMKLRLMNDRFSLSGFDSSVYVFSIIPNGVREEFKHFGHNNESLSKVTSHLWLPEISDRFLVSCAENGSLNCWEFIPKNNS